MGWGVDVGERITRQLVDMDDETQMVFLMTMAQLGQDPERWPAVGAKHEGERSVPVGDLGVIGFRLHPEQQTVEIVSVTWVG